MRFDADGEIVDAYTILEGTNVNCAGGPTPWGTWLSCEEFDWHGLDPALAEADRLDRRPGLGVRPAQQPGQGTPLPALGLFQHEAVAVDPVNEKLYLTEDRPDGRLYRFTPDGLPRPDRRAPRSGRRSTATRSPGSPCPTRAPPSSGPPSRSPTGHRLPRR